MDFAPEGPSAVITPQTQTHRFRRARAQREAWTQPLFRAKAPLRVSFAGGGTDVPPFPEREGGLVLCATINRFAHGTLRPRVDGRVRVESLDLGMAIDYGADEHVDYDGQLDLVKAGIRRVSQLEEPRGIDLFLHTAAPPGSGLGASSALMVALIGVLRDHHKLALTDYEIARLAWEVERVDLGLKGGLQDQYAATFGGFNFIEFGPGDVLVNPLRIRPTTMYELESNLLLVFTGRTRAGDHIIEDQTQRYEDSDEDALAGLRMQKTLALEMKEALLRGKLATFGSLLGVAWEEKKKMSPRISTPVIDEAYDEAIRAGALGGKVTGAGGGGFMLFYCTPGTRHKVAARLAQMGLEEAEFAFEETGLRTWTYVEG
ncbi:GHMP kinase [Baekduia soli]|uniref:GHMP kinase n=1 Tax=Baekduia soli TaxID=496014 RepID=A0A5B8U0Y6_9ACTN|nr:GHMP kinase [Baekduia soli]QEC46656.1 GHMP kinase [Baekduia soli]